MGIWRCNQNVVDALEAASAAICVELIVIQGLLAPSKEGPARAVPPDVASIREEAPMVAVSNVGRNWFQRLIARARLSQARKSSLPR